MNYSSELRVYLLFMWEKGCVAKNEQGHKRSDPDSNLCGKHEEIRHEFDLPPDVTFAYSLNLSFSDDVVG